MQKYLQIKACKPGENPLEDGANVYSRYLALSSIQILADELVQKSNYLHYYIVVYDMITRLPISYYNPNFDTNGDIRWLLFEGVGKGAHTSVGDVLFDKAFEELDVSFDYEAEVIKARQGQMAGSRLHKKNPKGAMGAISDEDIARMKAKFLK